MRLNSDYCYKRKAAFICNHTNRKWQLDNEAKDYAKVLAGRNFIGLFPPPLLFLSIYVSRISYLMVFQHEIWDQIVKLRPR